jgi:hypothetical protein
MRTWRQRHSRWRLLLVGQGGPGGQHQAGVRPIVARYSIGMQRNPLEHRAAQRPRRSPRNHFSGLLLERQNPPCIGQKPLALLGRRGLLPIPMQQRMTQGLFEPPDLLAHGRLGAVDAFASACEASVSTTETKLRRRSTSSVLAPFSFPLTIILSFNFQIGIPGRTWGACPVRARH